MRKLLMPYANNKGIDQPAHPQPGEYNISTFYSRNFKTQGGLCGCAGRFESYLVVNPEDRFSHDRARLCSIIPVK